MTSFAICAAFSRTQANATQPGLRPVAFMAVFALLLAVLSGCGGGGGGGNSTPDTTPPTFAGAIGAAAAGSTSITVHWTAATDNITPQSGIIYLVYRSTTTGFTSSSTTLISTTAAGATSYTDTGLVSGATYYYVVRAKDQAGNIDSNTVQVSAAPTLDTTPPAFAGATTTGSVTQSSITVGWNAATDNVTPQHSIIYLVYRLTTTGFTPSSSTLIATTAAGATSYTDIGLTADTSFYYVVRAEDQAGNIDTNTVQISATTLVASSDTTPPIFAGANSLTVQSGTSMTVSWSAASDDVTSATNIVYVVYRAMTSGHENYASPPFASTLAGALSYVDTTATTTNKYYYVVRAKDQAGNMDANTAEVFGPVSFTTDIYNPLMASTCTAPGCHDAATTSGGLNLSSATIAKSSLINVTALECPSEKFVAPSSSSTSYLVNKLAGTLTCGSGAQMPMYGPYFTATQLNTVKAWIDQGAADN
jgi:hypothetical protein